MLPNKRYPTSSKLLHQMYRKYVPNIMDDSLSLYEQMIAVIEHINNVVKTSDQLSDEVTADMNELITEVNDIREFALPENVIKVLQEWQESGYLNIVINESLQTQMDDYEVKIDQELFSFNEQLQQIAVNAKNHTIPALPKAKGDGITDDYVSLTAISSYCETNGLPLYLPQGVYLVSEPFVPPNDVWCFGVGQKSIIKAHPILEAKPNHSIVLCDTPVGQATFRLRDLYITGDNNTPHTNSLTGLQVGASRNSRFEYIVITNCWRAGMRIGSDIQNGQDVENPVCNQIYTAFCGGLIVDVREDIARGNITNAELTNCNFVTDIAEAYSKPICPIDINIGSGKLMFGFSLKQSFVQPRNAPTLRAKGGMYDCNFEDITADTWGETGFGNFPNTVYGMELEGVFNNTFRNINYSVNSRGLKLVNAKNNRFIGLQYRSFRNLSNGRIFDIDSQSTQNIFDGLMMDEENYLQMPGKDPKSQDILFGDDLADGSLVLMKDAGYGNIVTGSVFKNELQLLNEPEKLLDVQDGAFTEYAAEFNRHGVTCEIVDGKLRVTLTPAIPQFDFMYIPINYKNRFASVRLRYRFLTTDFTGTIANSVTRFGQVLIPDGAWHESLYIMDTTYDYQDMYGLFVINPPNKNVTIEIDKWEIYDGYVLPYVPNYTAK